MTSPKTAADEIPIDFRALAENSIDVIIRIDANAIASYVSPSIVQLLGITPEELIGKTHLSFVVPEDRPKLDKVAESQFAGQTDGAVTFRMIRPDGAIVWVEGRGRIIRDPESGELGFIIILRDISERKALESKLALLALTSGAGPLAGDRNPAGPAHPKQIERRQLRGRVPRRAH